MFKRILQRCHFLYKKLFIFKFQLIILSKMIYQRFQIRLFATRFALCCTEQQFPLTGCRKTYIKALHRFTLFMKMQTIHNIFFRKPSAHMGNQHTFITETLGCHFFLVLAYLVMILGFALYFTSKWTFCVFISNDTVLVYMDQFLRKFDWLLLEYVTRCDFYNIFQFGNS